MFIVHGRPHGGREHHANLAMLDVALTQCSLRPIHLPGVSRCRLSAAPPAPGYTLVEVMVSLAIATILFVAIGSTMLIAAKAAPGGASAGDTMITSSRALRGLADEFREAIHVLARSATGITFTVGDRNNDGRVETITYSWSGVVGEPLMRRLNNDAAAVVVPQVWQFNLAFDDRVHAEEYTAVPVESAEIELFKWDSTSDNSDAPIEATQWYGQYFKPAFVMGTQSWRVTRISLLAKEHGTEDGITTVNLELPLANWKPSGTVVATTPLNEATLTGSYQWKSIPFANAVGLDPNTGLVVTLTTADNKKTGEFRYQGNNVNMPNSAMVGDKPGWPWTPATDKALRIYVYGTKTEPAAGPQTSYRTFMTGVNISVQSSASAASQAQSSTYALNAPEALTKQWEMDFAANPTTIDLNADAVSDWALPGFNISQLVGGAWQCNGTLSSAPACDFNAMTAVDAKLRDTLPANSGPAVRMHVERVGDVLGIIEATTTLQAGGTQTLVLTDEGAGGVKRILKTITDLPTGWLQLRLLAYPATRSINVHINGFDHGTFAYQVCTKPSAPRTVEFFGAGAGAEFDHVRVRLGGTGNSPPTAQASADDQVIEEDDTVNFSAAGSNDPDNDPLTYNWSFGDGKYGTGLNVSHKYKDDGTFTAIVTVADDKGGFDTAKLTIKVYDD